MNDEPHPKSADANRTDDPAPPARTRSRLPWILGGILVTFGALTLASIAILLLSLKDPTHRQRDLGYQKELQTLLTEIRKERASPAPDFTAVRQKATDLREKIVPVMKNEASNTQPAKQALLFATRDELPRMMMGDLMSETMAEKNFVAHLQIAARMLQQVNADPLE